MEDSYLAARAEDVREVGHRILRCLTDVNFHGFSGLDKGSIVIAEEVSPADTALMDPREIGGFASVLGGAEGHTAIMARSLGLPAVVGVPRSEEHTSELQSLMRISYAVFCLKNKMHT